MKTRGLAGSQRHGGRTRLLLREGFKKDVRLQCALKQGKGLIKGTEEGAEGVGTGPWGPSSAQCRQGTEISSQDGERLPEPSW